VNKEKRKMDAVVIQGFPGKLTAVQATTLFTSSCKSNEMSGDGASATVLQQCIEKIVGKSVVIPSGATGRFRYAMTWTHPNPREMYSMF
jgi:hypothetical protein